nr:immunoglobulin light chain junction region [Mus musculus]
CLQYASSPPTF